MVKGGKKRADAARHRMGHKATVFMGSVPALPTHPNPVAVSTGLDHDFFLSPTFL